MQLGLPGATSPAREIEQARLIREAVGPDMDLMCDINQRWRVEQAIDIGKRVEDAGVGLYWLEDVTAHDDYAGLARVSAALATRSPAASTSTALCRSATCSKPARSTLS
jgi:L-alanine-DL-glutamate epimerase-like enolase superfamily enzyme